MKSQVRTTLEEEEEEAGIQGEDLVAKILSLRKFPQLSVSEGSKNFNNPYTLWIKWSTLGHRSSDLPPEKPHCAMRAHQAGLVARAIRSAAETDLWLRS